MNRFVKSISLAHTLYDFTVLGYISSYLFTSQATGAFLLMVCRCVIDLLNTVVVYDITMQKIKRTGPTILTPFFWISFPFETTQLLMLLFPKNNYTNTDKWMLYASIFTNVLVCCLEQYNVHKMYYNTQNFSYVVLDNEEASNTTECSICVSDTVQDSNPLVMLQCEHTFHKDCIQKWVEYKADCPLCRTLL